MTTQTLITIAPTAITSAKANTRGVDALATNGNSASVSYGSTNTNLLTVTWTDLADGDYDVIFFVGAVASYYDVLRVSGTTAILLGDRTTAVLDSASRAAILTQELIESYAADGAAPTVAQALMMLLQHHQQKSVSGTTVTIKKLDKSTTAGTYTLDSATDPTSITRAT